MREHDSEPIPGLPGRLPQGEKLLWQGKPDWGGLARRAMHLRSIALYFGVLLIVRETTLILSGAFTYEILIGGVGLIALAGAALAILAVLAWLLARSTIYSITSRRVVIRFGIAFQGAVNLPFCAIDAAGLRVYSDGTGDIPLTLGRDHRVGWLVMWPHVRPRRFAHPQPMLCAVQDADQVARILARALKADAAPLVPVRVALPQGAEEPMLAA